MNDAITPAAVDVHALERQFARDQEPLRDARVAPRRPDAIPLSLWRETPGFAPTPPADAP